MLKQKIIAFTLVFCMLFTISVQAFDFVSNKNKMNVSNSSVVVKNIDDNNALMCYQNLCDNKNILINKKAVNGVYHYSFLEANTNKELYSFDSVEDVNLCSSDTVAKNNMCAAVAVLVKAVISGEDIWVAFGAVFSSAMAFISNDTVRTVAALIAECGIAAIPEIIALLSTAEILAVIGGAAGLA